MVELKTKRNDADVAEFLGSIQDEQKRLDSQAICDMISEVTGEEPKMWGTSIIGFGSTHIKYPSGRELDWMLVGFSPRKANITLYIMTGFEEYAGKAGGYDPAPLLRKLGKYSTGKSCLYIKSLSDIDVRVLRQLVKESVAAFRDN